MTSRIESPFPRIRPARPADRESVERLLRACYPPLLSGAYDEELLADALPALVTPSPLLLDCGTWFVAEGPGDRLLACGGYTPERPGTDLAEPGLGHLRHFGTHPEHVRRGLARSIVRRCSEHAARRGIERFEAWSTRPAEPFYASLGLRRIRAITVPIPVLRRPGETVPLPSILMHGAISSR